MALGRVLRVSLFAAVVIGGAGIATAYPDIVRGYYLELYPSDPAKRQALELCFLQDHKFNRLDADERENCYRHALLPTQAAEDESIPVSPQANAIDLRRSAAVGHLPHNDIRRVEEEDRARRTQ